MLENILRILNEKNIDFELVEHKESKSCEDSKKFREELWLKWIWDKEIKARKFKKEFWTKDIRFANQDEITAVLDAVIWSIPPFGFENDEIQIFVDKEIFENEFFMFNPWVWNKTIRLKTDDLKQIYDFLKNSVKYFDFSSEENLFFDEI